MVVVVVVVVVVVFVVVVAAPRACHKINNVSCGPIRIRGTTVAVEQRCCCSSYFMCHPLLSLIFFVFLRPAFFSTCSTFGDLVFSTHLPFCVLPFSLRVYLFGPAFFSPYFTFWGLFFSRFPAHRGRGFSPAGPRRPTG